MIMNNLGPVAQLNRVSDSGSEGSGFEPQQGHIVGSRLVRYTSPFRRYGLPVKREHYASSPQSGTLRGIWQAGT